MVQYVGCDLFTFFPALCACAVIQIKPHQKIRYLLVPPPCDLFPGKAFPMVHEYLAGYLGDFASQLYPGGIFPPVQLLPVHIYFYNCRIIGKVRLCKHLLIFCDK